MGLIQREFPSVDIARQSKVEIKYYVFVSYRDKPDLLTYCRQVERLLGNAQLTVASTNPMHGCLSILSAVDTDAILKADIVSYSDPSIAYLPLLRIRYTHFTYIL